MSRLAVVVLNWNGADDTLACLASLRAQTRAPDELVVIDNGSEDDSLTRLRAADLGDRLVASPVNLGFAAGVNLGIERTGAKWVLLLNNDITLPEDALERLLAAAEAAPADVGMLQPVLLFRDRPELVNSSGVVLKPGADAADRDYERPLAEAGELSREPFCVTAGAGLYRRALLEAVALPTGVFDATHFMYFEDVDLGWRARLAGWSARTVPEVRVLHGFRRSSEKRPARFVSRLCRLNRNRMLLKNGSRAMLLAALLSPRPRRDLAWMWQAEGLAGVGAFLRALWDGLRLRPHVGRRARRARAEVEARWITRAP